MPMLPCKRRRRQEEKVFNIISLSPDPIPVVDIQLIYQEMEGRVPGNVHEILSRLDKKELLEITIHNHRKHYVIKGGAKWHL